MAGGVVASMRHGDGGRIAHVEAVTTAARHF
jgi:hypothetical protein